MGKIYVITGDGAGKTTSALGLAMRSIGHNHRVVMIQFMKFWKKTGEYKIQDKLKNYYKVYQFGRETWLRLSKEEKPEFAHKKFHTENPEEIDRDCALCGLQKARMVLKEKPDLLILDEICLAAHSGLLREKEVLDFLGEIPEKTTVVLTGRGASKGLIERADFVNTINPTKYPDVFDAKEGIQF
jgi:cob(I)alamin adenosyltransferase